MTEGASRPLRSRWFPRTSISDAAHLRLLCLPFAGGNASVFRTWGDQLGPDVDVISVQLPGRLERRNETPLRDARALAAAIGIESEAIADRPLALFGMSMGALIAYETAHALRDAGREPVHLIVASYRAPSIPFQHEPTHALDDDHFIEVLKRIGATPPELLEHGELMQLVLPTIRADFAVTESYRYRPRERLHCPITVVRARRDTLVTAAMAAAWAEQTQGPTTVVELDDAHMLTQVQPQLLALIAQTLRDAPTG